VEMFLICARADCLAKNVEVFSSMYALANEVGSEVYEYCASPISLVFSASIKLLLMLSLHGSVVLWFGVVVRLLRLESAFSFRCLWGDNHSVQFTAHANV